MSKAYLDTTILANVLLKVGKLKTEAKKAIDRFDSTVVPTYAIMEFKAGALKNYIWLHNKLAETKSLQLTYEIMHKMSRTPKSYTTSSATEAMAVAAARTSKLTSKDLEKKYGERAKVDRTLADSYRLSLKVQILSGWRKRGEVADLVVQPLSCYSEIDPIESKEIIVPGRMDCLADPECCLAKALRLKKDDLTKMKRAVDALKSTRSEDVNRSQVLGTLVRKPKYLLVHKDCRRLGDAVFAFFCPDDSVILTTNVRDHTLLAGALGKSAETP